MQGKIANAINKLVEAVKTSQPVELSFTGGITPKGAYSAVTAYVTGDSVYYTDGCSYVAIQNTTGNVPTNTTYWQKLADKGDTGNTGATGATGAAGADGAGGADGADGADGTNSINMLNGSGAPSAGLGVDNDYYLNNDNGDLYQKSGGSWGVVANLKGATGDTGATGATGAAGADGADGADGKTVLNGSGAPGGGTGVDGDFYIDTTNDDIYGPKSGGAWGSPTSLIGPTGATGATGATGPAGADGADGQGVPAGGTTGQVLQKASNTDYDTEWDDEASGGDGGFNQGFMTNGKINVSVASNNLTVAIKTLAGADPSAGDPVKVRIGNTVREITSALSVTKNAGTNWCNAGSSELAAKEIDYFVYLGYNATDGVVIGFSRIPYAGEYQDFSTTNTDEKYCAISTITNAASGDDYEVVGRFAATLSAGAGYTWTVPTFTNRNLIQRPVYETRWLQWLPTYSGGGSMTYTCTSVGYYKIRNDSLSINLRANGTTGGSASTSIGITTPMNAVSTTVDGQFNCVRVVDGSSLGGQVADTGTAGKFSVLRYDNGNWGIGSSKYAIVSGTVVLTQ